MNERKDKVKAAFDRALEFESPAERDSFLSQACANDAHLQAQVEGLLMAYEQAGSFLESPPAGVVATVDQSIREKPGTVIGRYKLLEQIGQGGFGVVFMAEQEEPVRRKVALKIIKPGMDTKEVIARFEAERQALAIMDHPNIAKVLDAGATESGRPYFVMELVRGIPITDYCDQNNLSTRDRLEIFGSVCQAVQHAHQKGIIHRDIKPSNVMVTMRDDTPVTKVIDFGVAKATNARLTEQTLFTRFGQMVGTPLYMSPEQASMSELDVDTRSDIYSLGVLLYELLTGTTPFDKTRLREAAYDELLRIIREEEPPKPSTRISSLGDTATTASTRRRTDPKHLTQFLRGDLDWIVMRALEKDRTRRYETAKDFAADIKNYLNDKPVEARPPSAGYRFRKFSRRNKRALVAASLVAAALIVGIVGTTWQAVRATQAETEARAERDIAETERNSAVEARQLADDRLQRVTAAERDAQESRQSAEARSKEVTHLLAESYVDQAQALCEQGEIGRGLLWFAHSLRCAPEEAVELRHMIRTDLSAWASQLHRLSRVIRVDGEARAVAFSLDGSRMAVGSSFGTIRVWDVATGSPIGKSIRHVAWGGAFPALDTFQGLVFSPDGKRILTASYENTAHLWDAATGEPIGDPLKHTPDAESRSRGTRVRMVAFSPDGSQIVTASGTRSTGTVRRWDAATLEPMGEPFQQGKPEAIAFCSDRLCVLTSAYRQGAEEGVPRWDVELWNVDRSEALGPAVDSATIFAAAIAPDGASFATADNDGGRIKLWRAETGEQTIEPIVHGGKVLALSFSSDGTRLVSGGNTRASMIWDTATGEAVGTPLRQQTTAPAVAISVEGTRILTGSVDGSVRLWEVARDRTIGRDVAHASKIVAGGYSVDGLRLLVETQQSLQFQDAATGQAISDPVVELAGATGELIFSPDGSRVLVQSSPPQVWDLIADQLVGELPIQYCYAAAFSPDSARLLTGSTARGQHFAQLWDTATLQPIGPRLDHPDVCRGAAFVGDGSRFLTGCFDGATRMWDTATLQPIGEPLLHHSEVKTLACSWNGRWMLVGFADGTVRLWDLETMEPKGVPLHHQNIVSTVAFSPDGSRFLTYSLDGTAQVWDTATVKPLGPRLNHETWWPCGSFSPDGGDLFMLGWLPNIATGQHARLWEAPPSPLEGEQERILCWTEVITGLRLDSDDGISSLDSDQWQQRYHCLQELGGPPATAAAALREPPAGTDFARSMKLAVRGRERAASGELDEAAVDFAHAVKCLESNHTLRTQIACWWTQLADRSFDSERYEDCETASRHAIAMFEQVAEAFPEQAVYRMQLQHQYDRLIRLFKETDRNKDELEAERQRTAVFQDVVDGFPIDWLDRTHLADQQVTRGIQLKLQGRPQEADKLFRSASLLAQTVIIEVGNEIGGDYQRTRIAGRCWQHLARIYAHTGRQRESPILFERAIAANQGNTMMRARFAEFLLRAEDPEIRNHPLALYHAEMGVRGSPDNPIPLGILGQVHYVTGDYAAAADALEKSVARINGGWYLAMNRLYLAMAQWQLGNREEALKLYDKAFERAKIYKSGEELGQLYEEAGALMEVTTQPASNERSNTP